MLTKLYMPETHKGKNDRWAGLSRLKIVDKTTIKRKIKRVKNA